MLIRCAANATSAMILMTCAALTICHTTIQHLKGGLWRLMKVDGIGLVAGLRLLLRLPRGEGFMMLQRGNGHDHP